MEATLRKARVSDIPRIQRLVNHFAEAGEMLPRSLNDLYENMRDFLVLEQGEDLLGCAACHVTWDDLAEIKSLAVAPESQGQGLGGRLVQACLQEAAALGITRVFVLTFRPEFFGRFGFRQVDKSELPHKIWTECINCPKFPDCGEVAMERKV